MGDFDQDAVNEAVRILQPQIDELKALRVGVGKQPVKYVVHYDDGTIRTFDLVPDTSSILKETDEPLLKEDESKLLTEEP